jgi:predicted dehydrogenase
MPEVIRIGVIGTGMWANDVHLAAFTAHPSATVAGVCDVDIGRARRTASRFDIELATAEPYELIEHTDIDAIDIVTPNVTHAPLALAALAAGKHVFCEKPMAMNGDEARQMVAAAEESGVTTGINFTWRNSPGAAYARHLVEQGLIGRPYHVSGNYLSSFGRNSKIPLIWRLQRDQAGTGALGDTGSHIIDLVEWITGEHIVELVADLKTFTPERPLLDGSGTGTVDVDDAASMMIRLEGGGMGTLLSTFYGTGQGMDQRVEIHGEKGYVMLTWQSRETITTSIGLFADEGQLLEVPVPKRFQLSEHDIKRANVYRFIDAIVHGKEMRPDFSDGLRNQLVLDAVVESATRRTWISL